MRKFLTSLFFFISIRVCLGFQADGPKYSLRQYTDENGLPQNSIQDFAFGNYGFLWIATQGGLVRFDGAQMVTFSKKDLGVDSDRYVAVGFDLEAGSGILTAVTENRQLVLIDGGTARRDLRTKSEQVARLLTIQAKLRAKGMKLDTLRNGGNYLTYKVIIANPKHYFIYTDQKVAFFENGALVGAIPFAGTPYFKPLPAEPHMRKRVVLQTKGQICTDNFMTINGTLFYHEGSEGPALLKLTKTGAIPMLLNGDITLSPAYPARRNDIRILTNRFKGQSFAYLAGNIYQIIYEQRTGQLTTRLLIEGLDIEEKLIHRMLYDEENDALFLGSVSQGLFLVRPHVFKVVGQGTGKRLNGLFYAQLPYTSSSVITPEGLVVGDSGVGPADQQFPGSDDETSRFGMLRDSDGGLWGVEPNGVHYLSTRDGSRKLWKTGSQQPMRLYQGLGKEIWIGSLTGEVSYLPHRATPAELPQTVTKVKGMCTYLYQDLPGKLWVGANTGLYLYDSLKKATYPVKGLTGKNIRSIFSSQPGQLWITTYGDGIFLLENNSLYKMPLDDKGYLAYSHCILEDRNGYFWISSNKGLFRAKKQDLIDYSTGKSLHVFYLYYNKEDGFLTNEFNGGCQPCAVKLGDGHFSFPTINGLVWFKPENIPLPDLSSPVRLENFILDEKPLATGDTVRLPYNFNHFSLRAVSGFMGLTDNVEFLSALTSSPTEKPGWQPVPKGQRIDIYHLAPGTYRVLVRQIIGFGGKYMEKQIILLVEPPWFLSWWFIISALLFLGVSFWQGTKWRVRSLQRQNALLTQKVEARTVDLSRTLGELKASDEALQTQLQIQMRIIGAINHDLHAPLRFLSVYVPRYLEQVSAKPDDPETVRLGASIGKSTLKVYRLADELLRFIKSTYNKKGKIAYSAVPLQDMLEKKVLFFHDIAIENQVSIGLTCPRNLTVTTNRIMAEIIVHNLIDNALKHTYAAPIQVTAEQEVGGAVKVTIADSGYGMETEICDWLNQGTKLGGTELSSITPPPANLGLGLIMVKEITTLMEIGIHAVSTPTGTTISLVFNK